ncbi:hypothetical protein NP493_405g00007 [Ridgeia piscesae]|uniref:Uncharacterized protein n=1 Tax=Ridgeia piscesae TaxID=27915 RepID=A0AAD9NVI1_RIDPI|nr:hypothetical protein NP493_405g00007 [Ridgeia piscesae]
MSDQAGDTGGKDRGRSKWTLVSTQGELEGSDDGTLSGSSSDFVHLEDEEVVSYHHKEPVASPGGSRLHCDISEAMAATSVDELVTTTDADDTVVPSDGVNNLSAHRRSLTTWDNCWFWDDDCIPKGNQAPPVWPAWLLALVPCHSGALVSCLW